MMNTHVLKEYIEALEARGLIRECTVEGELLSTSISCVSYDTQTARG